MMDAIYYPEAAAHLTFLSHELADDYRDFIWLLRERDQTRANAARAERFKQIETLRLLLRQLPQTAKAAHRDIRRRPAIPAICEARRRMRHVKQRDRICGQCRQQPAAKGQWRCKPCHAIYMRGWRKSQRAKIEALKAAAFALLIRKHAA